MEQSDDHFHSEVLIAGAGACVLLSVRPYEPLVSFSMESRVEVNAPPFCGAVSVVIMPAAAARFCAQLDSMQRELTGQTELEGFEDEFRLRVEMTSLGHAEVEGVIGSGFERRMRLTFNFETDQTFLAATVRDLRTALDA
jgi:hypothetical protein